MKKHVFFLAVLLIVRATPSCLAQATIHVPGDKGTIQAAINAAQSGDTVLVAPGTYNENVDFNGKNVVLRSEQGPSVTIIDGGGVDSVIFFHNQENRSATLDGFTIQHGSFSSGSKSFNGGGILISNASPTIINNSIANNTACGEGGGIDVDFASPLIQGNTIEKNKQLGCSGGVGGGGITVRGASTAQIIGNKIRNNTFGSGGGIALWAAGAALVKNNEISGNTASYGGAFYIANEGSSVIEQNLVFNNTASSGAGSYGYLPFTQLIDNTFVNNVGPTLSLSGIGSGAVIANNIIVAASGQYAVFCEFAMSANQAPSFHHNLFYSPDLAASNPDCSSLVSGTTNFSSDPHFLDWANLDFHLLPNSPAIDAGSNSLAQLPPLDYDGQARIADGNNDSTAIVDLGAFEFGLTTATVSSSALTFTDQTLLTQSSAQRLTVTNTGVAALRASVVISTADFIQSNTCGVSGGIAAGATCTIDVKSVPQQRGDRSAQLSIAGNLAAPLTVALAGRGIGPERGLSATSLSFTPQLFGTTSAAQTVTLSNSGEQVLAISSIATSGDFSQSNNCPASLNPSASCVVSVQFSPTERGARAGALTFTDNAAGSPRSVSLSGSGFAAAVQFSTSLLQFASQNFGTTSSAQPVVITNNGDLALAISGISISGDFLQTNNCPASLAVSASCTVQISFHPSTRGLRTGTLSVADGAPDSPHSIVLSGTGISPIASFGATSISFGNQLVGASSLVNSVQLRNTGDADLVITSVIITGDFSLTQSCPQTLVPFSFCDFRVLFTPSSVGDKIGSITITDSAPGSPHTIALFGTGVSLAFNPRLLFLGSTVVGKVSGSQTAALTNSGSTPLNISSITVSSEFAQTNNCASVLPTGQACTVTVTFAPTGVGSRIGQVAVSDDSPGSPHILSLGGVGVIPVADLSASSLVLPTTLVNSVSGSSQVTLSNFGSGPLTIASISTSGTFAQTNNCGTTLLPNFSCIINVTFSPISAGPATGQLVIVDDAAGSPQMVDLAGIGITTYPVPQLTSLSQTAAAVGSPGFVLTVTGNNFFPNSVVRWNGSDRPTTFIDGLHISASIFASDLLTLVPAELTVFTATPGGGISNSIGFAVYAMLDIEPKSLGYDPFTRRILASVASTAANYGNSLVFVDPGAVTVDGSLNIGSEPGKISISDSGNIAFVSLDGAAAVRKMDLPSRTAGIQFPLGSDSFFGPYYVDEMQILPGSDSALAVSRMNLGVSPRHAGVAVYDDGVKRTNETARHTGANSITFASSPNTLYGYNNETSEYGFRIMPIDANGISVQSATGSLIAGYGPSIRSDGRRIFSSNGVVVDPTGPSIAGTFALDNGFGNVVLPIGDAQRAVFVSNSFFSNSATVSTFDSSTFLKLGSMTLPFSGPNISTAVRWGMDGVAFNALVNNVPKLVLVRSSALKGVVSGAPPSFTSVSPGALPAGSANTILNVTGSGFAYGITAQLSGSERTVRLIDSTHLQVLLPASDFAASASLALTLFSPASEGAFGAALITVGQGSTVFTPQSLSFGKVLVGKAAGGQLTLRNTGAISQTLSNVSISDGFTQTNDCPASLAAGSSCTINVRFSPTTVGDRGGQVSATLGGNAISAAVTGTGFDVVLTLLRPSRPSRNGTSITVGGSLAIPAELVSSSSDSARFSCSGAPAGFTCEVSGEPVKNGHQSISVLLKPAYGRSQVVPGQYTLTLQAQVGEVTRSLNIPINVIGQRSKRLFGR